MGFLDDLDYPSKNASGKGRGQNVIDRLTPQTEGQMRYLDAINENRVVFCHGPAGCGKTFLAAGAAALALRHDQVKQIVCVRPAVGAGERNGFLPGSADEKLAPYLRPVLIELQRFFPKEQFKKHRTTPDNELMAEIEIQPVEFMRGLTFRDAFIVVDEAQNCTPEQMKMIVTRLGKGSKMIISGDDTQSDLPYLARGGFKKYSELFDDVSGVATVHMGREDIVRDELLRRMMEKIEEFERSYQVSAA